LLLKRRITSQAIDPEKMNAQGDGWVFSLPNIAVAMSQSVQLVNRKRMSEE
jgi:hypothetical protein